MMKKKPLGKGKYVKAKTPEAKKKQKAAIIGYYTKTSIGKFCTLKNNKVLEVKENEIKNYKQLRKYKKYHSHRLLDMNELNQVISEIKSYQ